MHVIETIDRLSEMTLSQPFRRKAEACFLLASRVAPFYKMYALATGAPLLPSGIRDHILFLWSQYLVGSTVSSQDGLQLESYMPDVGARETIDNRVADYAESAVICALHLTWYLAKSDDAYVKGCVVNYFDHVDELARDGIGSSGPHALADVLVARSSLFRREVSGFEAALHQDACKAIMSRPLLIANMDRDVSKYLE